MLSSPARIPPTHSWFVHTQSTKEQALARHESHQRSWWIVHTQPKGTGVARPNPQTQLVDRSYQPAKDRAVPSRIPPRSGGLFILSPTKGNRRRPVTNPTNAVGWIVHTQPTRNRRRPVTNPPNAVGGSFILSLQRNRRRPVTNPTNAVGGSFIRSQRRSSIPLVICNSHHIVGHR